GMTSGVSREELDVFNFGLLRPDIEILLDGVRFSSGIEKKHRNEGAGQEVWERNRRIHQELAREFGWVTVDANGDPEQVHGRIRDIILSCKIGE
ncbi:MAG: hypothetical protein AAB973_03540, partial [Patescibacteria group bacterium]